MSRPLPSRLLFVADASHATDLPALVALGVGAGVRFVELRRKPGLEPGWGSGPRLAELEAARVAASDAVLLVNDRVDLALLCGADGAHVGQDDLPAGAARKVLGPSRMLGVSTHDVAQAAAASDMPVDYVAVGPIFASATKSGHAEPLGLHGLAACRAACSRPLVAIGGIDAATAGEVLAAGADAVAVASAIALGDVAANVRALLAAVGEA